MDPTFFASAVEWRKWLEKHHLTRPELLVGFHKKHTGNPSLTWPEAVDQALCFGWIDGVRRRIDETKYSIRFTPRRPRSVWSAVNIRRAEELRRQDLISPAGLRTFESRLENRSRIYAYEQDEVAFEAAQQKRFRANRKAWAFFSSQPNWYRHTATWWVVNAKREDTREKRMTKLIEDSEQGRKLRHLDRDTLASGT